MVNVKEHTRMIAQQITNAEYDYDEDEDGPSGFDYIKDALDIEYIIGSNREYLGARVLVAFGGPNIWINTRTGFVDGYWWGDEDHAPFEDNLGIDEAIQELWECQ